jgi:hypothetical protein
MLSPTTATEGPEGWTQAETWRRQLKKGMNDEEALKILGEPKDKEHGRSAMVWYYQECPERIDAKVVSRPTCGFVKFNQTRAFYRSRQPIYQVYDWREPDWKLVKEMLAVESQKAAEIEAAKAEAARLKAEQDRKAAELRQAELAKQRARQQTEQEGTRSKQKEAEAAKSSIVDRIIMKVKEPDKDTFIYGGIGLAVLVVLVFILAKRPW